jgi:futalosine hydrolase
MYLLTAATDFEMKAFAEAGGNSKNIRQLVTGLGPVETTLSLSCLLHEQLDQVDAVLNFGVAGAYPDNGTDLQAGLLDICLAEQEILGDLGICLQDGFERFTSAALRVEDSFILDQSLLAVAGRALDCAETAYKSGTFITVNCASGTRKRGQLLGREFQGLCENMEGAAVARVCNHFVLPCLEVRCISNMVEDRDTKNWQLKQACTRAGQAAATIVNYCMEKGKR